jgi:folate-binding protein YgfZ
VAARLSKFLLRAKAKIADVSNEWDVLALLNQQRIEVEHALNIANGIPQVYAATSEQFVAQMLNLDVLDAISFTKGCYTGQEVIARAHYRGRVKRRMQRFRTVAAAALEPNDTGQLKDGRSFRVVDAVTLPDGRAEFLAVTTITSQGDDEGDTPVASAPPSQAPSIEAESLPLPYELPF